jgi:hypothetical protein
MLFDNVWGFWKSDVVNLLNISSISFSKDLVFQNQGGQKDIG